MTTVSPLNARASVKARLVADMDFDGPVPAGAFEYFDFQGPDGGILFGCPCGCGEMKSVSFRSERRPVWQWDGNREAPTLTPSINILQMNEAGKQVGEHWHGWLRNGEFVSC
jgi:hypothetical protein